MSVAKDVAISRGVAAARLQGVRLLLLVCLCATIAARPDRRIVDKVIVGDQRNEQEHAYAGEGVTTGITDGQAFRQARGWMRYALTVFDDTEVTIACTFGGGDQARSFDLVVENKVVATYTFNQADSATVEFRVPLVLTSGRTNILVMLRASNGATPPVLVLRSVQDHNE